MPLNTATTRKGGDANRCYERLDTKSSPATLHFHHGRIWPTGKLITLLKELSNLIVSIINKNITLRY